MSKVALLIREWGGHKAEAVAAIHAQLGLSLLAISRAVSARSPVLEWELFDRKNPNFPGRFLGLMEELDSWGVNYVVYELLKEQVYSEGERYYEITTEKLKNIINARAESLEQQRSQGQLEDD